MDMKKIDTEVSEARQLLATALTPIAPATAEALADETIELGQEEQAAVNSLALLLNDIYGDNDYE